MLINQQVMEIRQTQKASNTTIVGVIVRVFTMLAIPYRNVTYRFANIQEAVMKRAAILAIGLILFGASFAYSAPTCPNIRPIGGFKASQEGADIARLAVGVDRKVYVAPPVRPTVGARAEQDHSLHLQFAAK